MEEILKVLPIEIKEKVKNKLDGLEEIRIRVNKPVILQYGQAEEILHYIVDSAMILSILQNICDNSIYAYQEQICNGYVTIKGGHRVGITGNVVIKENKVIKSSIVKNLLGMGLPMGLQYSITAIGSMVMQGANNSLGATYMSAFAAAAKIKQLAICPFDALATAASTFASQNYGAKKYDRIKKGVIQTVVVGIIYGVIVGILLILFGRIFSMLFISSKYSAVLDASAKYITYMGYFYWVLSILNVCRQTTQGIGYSGLAIFSGVIEMIARCFVSLVFVPIAGYTAICCADQTAWIVAALYCVFTFSYCFKKIQEE